MQSQRRGRERSSSMKSTRCHCAEAELAVADRDRLAGGAEDHRHAVRVAVRLLHVLLADVLGAAVPVVVGVVGLVRDEPAQQRAEVLEHAALVLVHADAARRVGRVDEADAVLDARLPDDLRHLVGDVGDVEAPGGRELAAPPGRPSSPASVTRAGSGQRTLGSRGPVAQRLEQRTHNSLVPGSNPGGPFRDRTAMRFWLETCVRRAADAGFVGVVHIPVHTRKSARRACTCGL